MDVLCQVATRANVRWCRGELGVVGEGAVLQRKPFVGCSRVVLLGNGRADALHDADGGPREVAPQELRDMRADQRSLRRASEERARGDGTTVARATIPAYRAELRPRLRYKRMGVVVVKRHVAKERAPVHLDHICRLFGAAEARWRR